VQPPPPPPHHHHLIPLLGGDGASSSNRLLLLVVWKAQTLLYISIKDKQGPTGDDGWKEKTSFVFFPQGDWVAFSFLSFHRVGKGKNDYEDGDERRGGRRKGKNDRMVHHHYVVLVCLPVVVVV